MTEDWDARVAAVWADERLTDQARIVAIDDLAAERPEGDATALFERAGARDSAGLETQAEPLYREALAAGLDDEHRPQAIIQLASTIRNLGRVDESLELLRTEYLRDPESRFHGAAAAFYALALVSSGDAARGASVALEALAPHLPRYTRSVTAYARDLVDPDA
jgi:hypothetical protein